MTSQLHRSRYNYIFGYLLCFLCGKSELFIVARSRKNGAAGSDVAKLQQRISEMYRLHFSRY